MTAGAVSAMSRPSPLKASALRAIEIELAAVRGLAGRIDADFEAACRIILDRPGRVVVTGIGKSGHIGNKIAATLASTGTPALFVHSAEASHGDVGMITGDDVALAVSNSGNTAEILSLLPFLRRMDVPLISLVGDRDSELARAAAAVLDASVAEEACPLGLAPTASSTAALVLGDALATALMEARGFTRDDFAVSHPGGPLGRKLLVLVRDIMHTGDDVPKVASGTPLAEALVEMSRKGFGLTTVTGNDGGIAGVFTDGDLRRALDGGRDLRATPVDAVMSSDYRFVGPDSLAAEAARLMQASNVYVLIVGDGSGRAEGIVKMHDLLKAHVV